MRRQGGGAILNMASVVATLGVADRFAYSMSKGAVVSMTYSVAKDYVKDNIRCNSIHPSTVDTPMLQVVLSDPERRAERLDEIPLGRLATVTDVADTFVYLASDEAAFINGVAFPVDGGLTSY